MITIEPATLRDVSWIAAHMNEADHAEIMSQARPGMFAGEVGAAIFHAVPDGMKWVAHWKGIPVAAFGFCPINYSCWSGWAFGTKSMWRAVPDMTRHFLGQREMLMGSGVRRLEARSLVHHKRAFVWVRSLGARQVCELSQFGRNGETFILWEWTKD